VAWGRDRAGIGNMLAYLLTEPFLHDRGTLTVPDKPGLGFDVDSRLLEKHAIKYFEASRTTLVWMPEKLP
jgi:L-alanine-DL-glutamate epimerase-like enolase superfamily enzyme